MIVRRNQLSSSVRREGGYYLVAITYMSRERKSHNAGNAASDITFRQAFAEQVEPSLQ
jgi:hypothetical protein